ncbi:hypothetical protein [Cupriavidus sp. AcVe19-6a]|uniref:hypothetical protein n=1 Tax=Cupriavidus sp. AcVe19-6a TaxID=2821358 RepID=UPI001AE5CD52|nr:hypothetical protein [Cupriavidus sp. AcVe19-6a]MBP0634252.1 hypothetical protein [Cupriavidus sp. AcVe19-6a]
MPSRKKHSVITMLVLSEAIRRRSHEDRAAIVRRVFAADMNRDPVAQLLERSAQAPADTVTPSWAAELVAEGVAEFFATLPASIYGALAALAQGVNMRGLATLRVPGRDRTKRLNVAWVGEGAPIPVSGAALTGPVMTKGKLACITTTTDELLEATDSAADAIELLLKEDAALALDMALLSTDDAVEGVSPPGLLHGVTAIPGTEDPVADVRALLAGLGNPTAPVFIVNSLQLPGLAAAHLLTGPDLLANMPLIVSPSVTPGRVVAADASDIVLSTGEDVRIDLDNVTTIHEEDTSPDPIVDGAGVVAAPTRSLWQTSCTAIKIVYPAAFAKRRADAVAYLDAAAW